MDHCHETWLPASRRTEERPSTLWNRFHYYRRLKGKKYSENWKGEKSNVCKVKRTKVPCRPPASSGSFLLLHHSFCAVYLHTTIDFTPPPSVSLCTVRKVISEILSRVNNYRPPSLPFPPPPLFIFLSLSLLPAVSIGGEPRRRLPLERVTDAAAVRQRGEKGAEGGKPREKEREGRTERGGGGEKGIGEEERRARHQRAGPPRRVKRGHSAGLGHGR